MTNLFQTPQDSVRFLANNNTIGSPLMLFEDKDQELNHFASINDSENTPIIE